MGYSKGFSAGFRSVLTLYLDFDDNCFTDEFGNIIYNIYQYIAPNDLFLFRNSSEPVGYIPSQRSKTEVIELVYT